jgi:hypothetical protein
MTCMHIYMHMIYIFTEKDGSGEEEEVRLGHLFRYLHSSAHTGAACVCFFLGGGGGGWGKRKDQRQVGQEQKARSVGGFV